MTILVVHNRRVRYPSITEVARLATHPTGGHLLPAITAGIGNEIDLVLVTDPPTPWPTKLLRAAKRPTLVLICDDPRDVGGAGGPEAWKCSGLIGTWCERAIVHAAGGEAWHYDGAVGATVECQRLALIETTPVHALAWASLVGPHRTVLIRPRAGSGPIANRVLH